MSGPGLTDSPFRPELQGLRALAVSLVVLYHFWPDRLTGGFVGVDVFFVVSGFLITSHLMREVERTGSVSLRNFWARRIRRLLPASLLVLVVCALATYLWVFPTQWATTARSLVASAVYLQNWELAAASVDYLAQGNAPTLVQHFWSLSVEEQFYVVWPLLLVGGLFLSEKFFTRLSARSSAAIVISAVGLASFASSVVLTARDPAWAYFATFTRLWELALGAGLALISVRLTRMPRIALGWAGLLAILLAALAFDAETAFPGWVAIVPTLGTAAVIAAGRSDSPLGAAWWLSLRPATFLGDISYAVYLWHWPVLLLAPLVLARSVGTTEKLVAITLTAILSYATKVWVEDRYRKPRVGKPRLGRVYGLAVAGMAVVIALAVNIQLQLYSRVDAAASAAASLPAECVGPGALASPQACGGAMGSDLLLVAPPEVVALQNRQPAYPGCQQDGHRAEVLTCTLGSDDPTAPLVFVVGDSHGTQWFPSLDRLGQERGLRIETYTKSGCPPTAAERIVAGEGGRTNSASCRLWLADVNQRVLSHGPGLVIVTSYSSEYDYSVPEEDVLAPSASDLAADPAVAGYAQLWRGWVDHGIDVAAIAAIPRTQGESVPDCLAGNASDFDACATDREAALPPDPLVAAATQAGAAIIDFSDQFCHESRCYPVIGNVIVYRDHSHLSREYSLALTPYLESSLSEWLSSSRSS